LKAQAEPFSAADCADYADKGKIKTLVPGLRLYLRKSAFIGGP